MKRYKLAKATQKWIVADMDKTLMDKKAGTYPLFAESPAFLPILNWLQRGGKLLCVTSDDGYRPFHQFWDNIPTCHKKNGQVLLSTAGGATLYKGNDCGEAVKVDSFFTEVSGGIPISQVTKIARCIVLDFFLDALDDRSLLKRLAGYRRVAYEKILKDYPSKQQLKIIFTEKNMIQPGKIIERGTLIWRNQAGPPKSWIKFKDLEKNGDGAIFTNLFILGLPSCISMPYIQKYSKSFEALDVCASAAPNSVCISNNAVDKGTVIKWLNDTNEFDMSYENCIAIGDNPNGNDYPLTRFQHVGMPFINCGDRPSQYDTHFIGGYEVGVGKFVEGLNDMMELMTNSAADTTGNVSCNYIFKDCLEEAVKFSTSSNSKL